MPTYEYECDACGHAFELFQSITEKPAKKCPSCGKAKARRLISSGGAILFKGDGFYITDYRSEDYRKKASADKAPSSSGESKSSPEKKSSSSGKSTAEAAG